MTDLNTLEEKAQTLVQLATKAGADACDVVVASGGSLQSSVREGKVENTTRSEADSLSLRVFCGKKLASVNSDSNADPAKLAERAVAMARVSPEDPFQGLGDKDRLISPEAISELTNQLELYDPFEPEISYLEEMALEAEAAGLDVEGVAKSMGAGASWRSSGFVLATSAGFSGSYERSGFGFSAAFVAGEGTAMERDYEYDSAIHHGDLQKAAEIGRKAGERTVRRLGAKQVKSGSFPIVCDRRISTGILGALAGAINGASIARKTSFLRDKMGKQITGKAINIVDDPHMVRGNGSRVFDGEGLETSKLALVSDGVLQTWLLDGATARELDLESNARASRSGSGTSPSTTNCYMEAGSTTFDEMIAGISQGFYLTETIGHGINMVTGDYSKGASGYWIENGEITYPVAEITVAGNLADMFMNMTPADDLEFKYSTNAPTLLIEGMTIGGL